MVDLYAVLSKSAKTSNPSNTIITEKDVEKRKKEARYNSIIDYLAKGKNVEGLLLSLEYKIEIPENQAINAANEIAKACYDDPYGTFMDLAGKIRLRSIELVSGEKPGTQELVLNDKLEAAVLTTYRKYGLIADAERLESRRKSVNSWSMK